MLYGIYFVLPPPQLRFPQRRFTMYDVIRQFCTTSEFSLGEKATFLGEEIQNVGEEFPPRDDAALNTDSDRSRRLAPVLR